MRQDTKSGRRFISLHHAENDKSRLSLASETRLELTLSTRKTHFIPSNWETKARELVTLSVSLFKRELGPCENIQTAVIPEKRTK